MTLMTLQSKVSMFCYLPVMATTESMLKEAEMEGLLHTLMDSRTTCLSKITLLINSVFTLIPGVGAMASVSTMEGVSKPLSISARVTISFMAGQAGRMYLVETVLTSSTWAAVIAMQREMMAMTSSPAVLAIR